MWNDRLTPIVGRQRLTNTTSTALTVPDNANYAIVFLETDVRWTDDATAAVAAASGGCALAKSGGTISLTSRQQMTGFRMIPASGTAEAQVYYYQQASR